jgi:mono/diheme cytochrome c family protein
MRALRTSLAIVVSTAALAAAGAVISAATQVRDVERGRYLSIIGGCNDCHTPGYLEKSGAVPESLWLSGSPLGFQGPWGTTYASNLRLIAAAMSEAEWLTHARAARRPPMPWFNVRAMSDADLGALYAYLRSLGPGGEPAPAYVPPGEHVATPYIDFVPKNVPAERRAAG